MQRQLQFILLFVLFTSEVFGQPTDIPNAQPGKCYAKCYVPDKYETVTEQIMLRPESEETTAAPPVFETANGQYVSKESCVRLVPEPAEFDVVEERILVSPPGRKTAPSAYMSVQEDVLLKPATRSYAVSEAVFETVQEPVEIEPAYMLLEVLPQRYEPVLENVEVRAASTKWIRKPSNRNCLGADPEDCLIE